MLKGIDPILSGELLKVLDEMGHADQLLLADRNYPAASSGRPVIRLGEITQLRALEAILGVFPLDTFIETPFERMEVDDDPSIVTPAQEQALAIARANHEKPLEYGIVKRLDVYERARNVAAVVQTLDATPYSVYFLTKGVVFD